MAVKADPKVSTPTEDTLQNARDALSEATSGRPDFEGFIESLYSEAAWVVQLYADKPQELLGAKSDAETLEALAADVRKAAERLGFL